MKLLKVCLKNFWWTAMRCAVADLSLVFAASEVIYPGSLVLYREVEADRRGRYEWLCLGTFSFFFSIET